MRIRDVDRWVWGAGLQQPINAHSSSSGSPNLMPNGSFSGHDPASTTRSRDVGCAVTGADEIRTMRGSDASVSGKERTMRAVLLAASLCSIAVSASAQTARPGPGPLTIASQGSFFIGGRDVKSDTLSTLPAYVPTGTITIDQMYVRYQVPVGDVGVPITLIHGCCLTGKTWETTPDGRMGWDEYFVRHGHPTYVIDQVWRGRSAGDPSAINAVRSGKEPADQLPKVFSAGHEGAWAIFRF